jgi:hypothetical protein
MKVETNIKSGNALQDVASLGGQSLQASANFITSADQQARRLADNLSSAAQSAWDVANRTAQSALSTVNGWL